MTIQDRLGGCILGGAIGDAWGSAYEFLQLEDPTTFYWGGKKAHDPQWAITDDTQLTLISLEALSNNQSLTPSKLAEHFLLYFKKGAITGIGASTLKSLKELEVGGSWNQVGRQGEYAAGNGAAMRIAPFAFWSQYNREDIRNFCRITHRNEEAYVGSLAVVLTIRHAINKTWSGDNNLFDLIIPDLPDVKVRDRLIEINSLPAGVPISTIAKFGVTGYVVDSIPFAIAAASKVSEIGLKAMYEAIINAGGDTDTNASIAGQIAGAHLGIGGIDFELINKLKTLHNYSWINEKVEEAKSYLKA